MPFSSGSPPNNCAVVLYLLPELALMAKMGVPVKPNIMYFLIRLVMMVCISPNWLLWHSSNISTILSLVRISRSFSSLSQKLGFIRFDSFWMVVMMMVALSSLICFSRILDELLELAQLGSKLSYSFIV